MPISGSFFRYSVPELISSGARGLIRPSDGTEAPPTKVGDILDSTTLDPVDPWIDVGAAREGQGSAYERGLTVTDLQIEQSTATAVEEVNESPRSITLQLAEFTPEKVQILLNAPSVTTIAASAHNAPGKRVQGGAIDTLSRYTVALLGQRRVGEGRDITDEAGTRRGEIVGWVLFSATIAAANASMEIQKGQLANVPLEFRGLPHPLIADPRIAVDAWITEQGPATIAAA